MMNCSPDACAFENMGSADSSSTDPSSLDWLVSMTDSYQLTVLLLETADIPLCNSVPTSRRDLFHNRRCRQRTMKKTTIAPMITIASPATSPATHVRFLVEVSVSALDVADAGELELVVLNVLFEDDNVVEEADGVHWKYLPPVWARPHGASASPIIFSSSGFSRNHCVALYMLMVSVNNKNFLRGTLLRYMRNHKRVTAQHGTTLRTG